MEMDASVRRLCRRTGRAEAWLVQSPAGRCQAGGRRSKPVKYRSSRLAGIRRWGMENAAQRGNRFCREQSALPCLLAGQDPTAKLPEPIQITGIQRRTVVAGTDKIKGIPVLRQPVQSAQVSLPQRRREPHAVDPAVLHNPAAAGPGRRPARLPRKAVCFFGPGQPGYRGCGSLKTIISSGRPSMGRISPSVT